VPQADGVGLVDGPGGRGGVPAALRLSLTAVRGPPRRRLALEQTPLAIDAPPVAGHAAVAAHHPVARDDEGDRIRGAGPRDRARRGRLPDAAGDLAVGPRLPAGDRLQLLPHPALEGRGAEI